MKTTNNTNNPNISFITLALTILSLLPLTAAAKNIDLSTVPQRDTVQLTIYNSEDITLVRETRIVSFKKGSNPLQFSWANTLIDPSSVELRFLTNPDNLVVLDTTFPHDKPQMLYWNVNSDFTGQATIEITYFTSGITWSADYTCIADHDETEMAFKGFVRISNNSGEEYENAQIRLVVGTINLVEKIAELAQLPMSQVEEKMRLQKGENLFAGLRRRVAKSAMGRGGVMAMESSDAVVPAPKEIIKEGLSEYFIYTIQGTETIKQGWSKRMQSFKGQTVPFKIQYRYRPRQYGNQLVRMYLLTNDEKSKLGSTPLPNGTVRLFRHNNRDGLSYLATQQIKYIPIGDKIELNLGSDPNVIFELIKLKTWRDNIWMKHHRPNLYTRADQRGARIELNSKVAGWNDHEIYTQRIRNYTKKSINVEVRRQYQGDVTFRSQLKPKLHDYRTVQFTTTVEPAQKKNLPFEIIRKQNYNAKQNNVKLQSADIDTNNLF